MLILPTELSKIPELSGVYRYYDIEKKLLYVGKAKNLLKRVSSYFSKQNLSEKTLRMVGQISSIDLIITQSETEALLLENHLIRQEKPKYNVVFRDDKSYPYLKISNHAFPRISIFRGKNNDNSLIFGPYPNNYSLRDSMQILQKIFKLRNCEDTVFKSRSKPCLLFQIKRCSAPCVNLISNLDYTEQIKNAISFLNGNNVQLFNQLEQKMHEYAQNLNYERAALIRDQIQVLSNLFKQQNIDIGKNINLDVIGMDIKFNKVCLAIGMIRNGRHLGYKTLIKDVPIDIEINISAAEENIIDDNNQIHQFKIISLYLEQNEDYVYSNNNVKILSKLNQRNWQEINTFLPNLKPYSMSSAHAKSWLESAFQNAQLSMANFFNSHNHIKKQAMELKNLLNLDNINPTIHCFDISHTSGDYTKGSCVCFQDYNFERKKFRHYNLQTDSKGDDYQAMYQAVYKHYKNIESEELLPHIILIDGGVGQVNAAILAMTELNLTSNKIIGISKGDGRKIGLESLIFYDESNKLCNLMPSLNNLGLVLLTNIRDMAHDYAVLNMQKKRAKNYIKSALEDIDGIGATKKQKLLTRFGSVNAISNATIYELLQVHGINQILAEKIYYYFHKD